MVGTPAMITKPRVVVVVLNWNGREHTLRCLESLEAVEYENWEIIVVDNGSTDGSVEEIRKKYPDLVLIEVGTNLGFTGGNNVGIRWALKHEAEFVLLLNNDTVVAPDFLSALVAAGESYPGAGVLGAKIYFWDTTRVWYAGSRWRATWAGFEHVAQGTVDNGIDFEEIQDTAYVSGCAMFLRLSAVHRIGMLDPRFFLLFEETEWCSRARKAGYQCLMVPRARVWHRVSASFGDQRGPLYEYFWIRNRLLWAELHLPFRQRTAVWADTVGMLFAPWAIILIAWHAMRGRYNARQVFWEMSITMKEMRRWLREPGERAVSRARYQGVWDYLTRRFGDCPTWVRTASQRESDLAAGRAAAWRRNGE
jgi:GT2 family glycosyltransferase